MAVPEKCADCGGMYIWRTRRHLLDRLVASKAFACKSCGKRVLEFRAMTLRLAGYLHRALVFSRSLRRIFESTKFNGPIQNLTTSAYPYTPEDCGNESQR